MVENFNPNSVRNPSSGLLGRNPTHIDLASYAEDQSDIVKAIKDTGVKRMQITYEYADIDPTNPPPLMGITKIRTMSTESAQKFCKNLMRARPNIFKLHIKLGDYPKAKRINDGKVRVLSSNRPRFHTEIGEKLGDIISDPNLRVTEVLYVVHNADPGYFNATAEVYGTTDEEYADDKLFKPIISFEFIKTT